MQRNPPLPLISIAVVCIGAEATVLLFQFKALGLVRIALHFLLLFLAIRGKRGAAEFWGFLSIVGGVLTGYSAFRLATVSPLGASLLALYAAFLLVSAAYVFKSRRLAEFFDANAEPDNGD
ncbi:MAG: hypothetical protein KF740_11965 [Ramlibacter sp.]|nr:hypothetical protein [Ramlibacter sp.]